MDFERADKDNRRRMQIDISKQLKHEVKKRSVDRNISMSEWVEMAIVAMIKLEDSYQ
jgi:hypothetical protein